MNTVTIAEMAVKKQKLQASIAKSIEDFANENGVAVEGISLDHDPVVMNQQGDIVNKVRFSVQLRVWL